MPSLTSVIDDIDDDVGYDIRYTSPRAVLFLGSRFDMAVLTGFSTIDTIWAHSTVLRVENFNYNIEGYQYMLNAVTHCAIGQLKMRPLEILRYGVQSSCHYEVDYSPGLVRYFSSNSSSLNRTLFVALELEDKQFS